MRIKKRRKMKSEKRRKIDMSEVKEKRIDVGNPMRVIVTAMG